MVITVNASMNRGGAGGRGDEEDGAAVAMIQVQFYSHVLPEKCKIQFLAHYIDTNKH